MNRITHLNKFEILLADSYLEGPKLHCKKASKQRKSFCGTSIKYRTKLSERKYFSPANLLKDRVIFS